MLEGVEVRHLGLWPKGANTGQVQLLGVQPREKMVEEMKSCHYFLHTAVKDPCPNAIFEAICMGLPVIYNSSTGSSAEIVGDNGFSLDESNLKDTVTQAREKLQKLRETVLHNRSTYTINRATQEYKQVFEELMI